MACKTSKVSQETFDGSKANYIETVKYDQLKSDPYTVVSSSRNNDILSFKIKYGGGCGDVKLNLYASKENPNVYKLVLRDKDNCKSYEILDQAFQIENTKKKTSISVICNSDTLHL